MAKKRTVNKFEKSLVLIKPDGVERNLIGEIIKRYEMTGLKLVALKMVRPDEKLIERHYLTVPGWKKDAGRKAIEAYKRKEESPPTEDEEEAGEKVLRELKVYLTSFPVIAMVWEGLNAVGIVKKITGGTEPLTSDIGTIRGDLTVDSYREADTEGRAVHNLVHASESPKIAEEEIGVWFNEEELSEYRLPHEL